MTLDIAGPVVLREPHRSVVDEPEVLRDQRLDRVPIERRLRGTDVTEPADRILVLGTLTDEVPLVELVERGVQLVVVEVHQALHETVRVQLDHTLRGVTNPSAANSYRSSATRSPRTATGSNPSVS